tara:strand:+ start:614 stop:820 length:207 start_codon:yes stop_codon:yes gene_type:complete
MRKYEVIMYREVLQNTVISVEIDSTDIEDIMHEAYQQCFNLKESKWAIRNTRIAAEISTIRQPDLLEE